MVNKSHWDGLTCRSFGCRLGCHLVEGLTGGCDPCGKQFV